MLTKVNMGINPQQSVARDIIMGLKDVENKNIKLLILQRLEEIPLHEQVKFAKAINDHNEGKGTYYSGNKEIDDRLEECYHLIDNPMLIYSYGKQKQPYYSTELPLNSQFQENWGWENSAQFYELDTEFIDKEYFQNIEPVDICHLVRKMDKFLMERGISYKFLRNYEHVLRAFKALDEPQNNPTDEETDY